MAFLTAGHPGKAAATGGGWGRGKVRSWEFFPGNSHLLDVGRSSPVLALLMEDDPLETGAAPEDEEEAEELVLLQRHPTVFLLE